MREPTYSRRSILRRIPTLLAGGAVLSALSGCRNEGRTSTASSACADISGLSTGERHQRDSLQYVDQSPHGDAKNCRNCQFFQASPGAPCGGCTAIKGPIDPQGYCSIWTQRPA